MNKQLESNSNYNGAHLPITQPSARLLSPQEEAQKPWMTLGKTLYILQPDESVSTIA